MTTSNSQYVLSPWLTPVRLVSSSNVSGTYFNGPTNSGVGATLTIAASSLTVDSVVANVGDRILLEAQSSSFQNGIYVVSSISSTVVLTRAEDMQNVEQFKAGLYTVAGAGSTHAGNFYTVIEPLPNNIGVDAITFSADSAAGVVTFSGPPSTANALAVFSDTAGDLKAQSTTSTLGFGLTISTGNLAVSAGNITAGSSGNAGTVGSFPSGATSGELLLAAVTNSSGNFNTTISNASAIAQSQVVSIPDSGAATANFILSASGGTQHITSGALQVDAGAITSGLSTGGFVGLVKAFPTTATKGFIAMQAAVNATGNFGLTLSNSTAQAQASTVTFLDPGASTGFVPSTKISSFAGTVPLLISFDVTVGQAALATGGAVTLVASSGSKQFKIRSLQLNSGGTNFSGGGGDRLGQVTDGTTVYSVVPAATMQSLANAQWGVTALPNPAAAAINTSTAAGAAITFKYSGGTTDYTAGSLVITGLVEQVA